MCKFFSMCSDGNGNPIYFDWALRKKILDKEIEVESPDSHTSLAHYFGHKGLKEDKLNKYEYNPLTKVFTVDQINTTDDKSLIEHWVKGIDFKTIVPHLNLYPIKNPLETKAKKVSKKDLLLLQAWIKVGDSVRDSVRDSVSASVGDSVWDSVWDSVGASVSASVGDSVGDSVWDSVRASVWYSVRASVWAYISSFIILDKWKYIDHEKGVNPFQSCIELYKKGLVPSFDGKLWRLHSNRGIVWTGKITNGEIYEEKAIPSNKSKR